jgi:hypothetical protein
MNWLFLIAWGFLQIAAGENVYDHTVASIKNVELDIKALAASLSKVRLPTFSHAHELLAALNAGDAQFQVKESDKDASHLQDLEDFDAMASKAIYDTETNYTIHRNAAFINLDAPATTILTISDSHVEHCHPSLTSERLLKITESSAEEVGLYPCHEQGRLVQARAPSGVGQTKGDLSRARQEPKGLERASRLAPRRPRAPRGNP